MKNSIVDVVVVVKVVCWLILVMLLLIFCEFVVVLLFRVYLWFLRCVFCSIWVFEVREICGFLGVEVRVVVNGSSVVRECVMVRCWVVIWLWKGNKKLK